MPDNAGIILRCCGGLLGRSSGEAAGEPGGSEGQEPLPGLQRTIN